MLMLNVARGAIAVAIPTAVFFSIPTTDAHYSPAGSSTNASGASRSAPAPAPDGNSDIPEIRYDDCGDLLRTVGRPIFRTEPGYRRSLDRNEDGWACEWRERDRDGRDGRRHDGDDDDDSDTSYSDDHSDRSITTYINNYDYSTVEDDTDATFSQWGEDDVPNSSGGIATGGA